MQITRVLNLTDDEINKLVSAGETLGDVKRAFEQNQADGLSDAGVQLIQAIYNVTEKVLSYNNALPINECEACSVPVGE